MNRTDGMKNPPEKVGLLLEDKHSLIFDIDKQSRLIDECK